MSMQYTMPSQDPSTLAADNPQFVNGSPGLASDVLTSPGAASALPAVATANLTQSMQDAADNAPDQGSSILSWAMKHIVAPLAGASGGPGALLSKPLQEVQQDYRFIHAVYTMHGPAAGALMTLGMAGGAAVGSFAGDEGAKLGGEAAAEAETQLAGRSAFQDSLARAQDPNYRVSFGRDVANLLLRDDGNTDSGLGRLVSGAADAAFDMTLDPVIVAGKAKTAITQGKYLEGGETGLAGIEGVHGAPTVLSTKFGLPSVWQIPRFEAMLARNSIAARSSAQIDALRYGKADPLAVQLGHAPQQSNGYTKFLTDAATSDTGRCSATTPSSALRWPPLSARSRT